MLTFPKSTHRLYFFQASNSFYVADLDRSRTIQLSQCELEFLSLYRDHTIEEVREELSSRYSSVEIDLAIERLEILYQDGLIFDKDDWSEQWKMVQTSSRPRLFIPQGRVMVPVIALHSAMILPVLAMCSGAVLDICGLLYGKKSTSAS